MAFALAQYGSGAVITAVLHPFGYAKVLMQMGHEPLQPEVSTTFFFHKQTMTYPNIFKYIGHIKYVDGFWGLYRGVFPRVLAGTLGNLVQYNIQDKFKALRDQKPKGERVKPEDEDFVPWLQNFAKETSEDTLARCCGVIVSHPFHVIMVRSMVQFVGRETQYNTVWSSVKEIYEHDGILGFFSGLIPRLIGEILTIWLTSFLAQTINKYLVQEKDLKSYTGAACGLVVSHFTYPFTLVTNIMAVNNCGLRASQPPMMPVYNGWVDCLRTLAQEGNIKRGANAFWRTYNYKPTGVAAYKFQPQGAAYPHNSPAFR
ncbi:mitochondrial carrier homolog 2 [Aplysia californica]|uniref:Mitochondrial carrier homolog 2 n=1 Tax=Aplysia californica TaxID=6500 RepID=A0ABM0JWE5_APLCA|nr:mitochondrial carrier homolog 2 [Aplysia californica]